jgi:inner membrane protein
MAAILSHAVAGAGIAAALRPGRRPPARYWALAIACAVVPDLDILVVWMGANYLGMFGHRGFMHSISFTAALAALLSYEAFSSPQWRNLRLRVGLAFFAAGVFHGILDAMMSAGKGVAFFAPFSRARFHFPIRPIRVSPPSSYIFLREGGIRVSGSEIAWIWAPSVLLFVLSFWLWNRCAQSRGDLVSKESAPAGLTP